MERAEEKENILPQRLCSEIQLFDLCDLNSCGHKKGRFCSNQDLVARFEKISEDEVIPPQRFIDEELDEDYESDEEGYDEDEIYEDDQDDGWESDE